jgi:hypothetical protein
VCLNSRRPMSIKRPERALQCLPLRPQEALANRHTGTESIQAEPEQEPHHYDRVRAGAVTRCSSGSRPDVKQRWNIKNNHSSGGFLVHELVISGGITITLVDSSSVRCQCPAESLFVSWRANVCTSHSKSPQDGNNSWIPYSDGYVPPNHIF